MKKMTLSTILTIMCSYLIGQPCPNGDLACPGGTDDCNLCNDNDILDLNALIVDPGLFTQGGKWTVTSAGINVPLVGALLDATNLPHGNYTIRYDILPEPSGTCPKFDEVVIKIRTKSFATITPDTILCNGPTGITEFNLDLMNRWAAGGTWKDANGALIPLPYLVNVAGLPAGGTANFTFTVVNQLPCANAVYPVLLKITDDCTSVGLSDDAIFTNTIDVFPNSSDGILVIHMENAMTKTHIQVYDLFGQRLLLDTILQDGANEFDLTNLSNGVYAYNITQEGIMIKAGKWVKI
jgi:hypothetical protein